MKSESEVSADIELVAPDYNCLLFRNNVGAMRDPKTGRVVRYGLANLSAAMNKEYKSADYVGPTTVKITPEMVGQVIGIFTSYEIKHEGWRFTGRGRERGQENWRQLMLSRGCIARFVTSLEDLGWENRHDT